LKKFITQTRGVIIDKLAKVNDENRAELAKVNKKFAEVKYEMKSVKENITSEIKTVKENITSVETKLDQKFDELKQILLSKI